MKIATQIALAAWFLVLTGCASNPLLSTAKTAGFTAETVESAMQFWGDWVKNGNATIEQRQQVRLFYQRYQAVNRAVLRFTLEAIESGEEGRPLPAGLLDALEGSQDDLLNLIRELTT